MIETTMPVNEINCSGTEEKLVTRSKLSWINLNREYLDCPAALSSCATVISVGLAAYKYASAGIKVRDSLESAISRAISLL